MIAIGLLALVMAALENRRDLKVPKTEHPNIQLPRSFSTNICRIGLDLAEIAKSDPVED
jgi:hypothetical protein